MEKEQKLKSESFWTDYALMNWANSEVGTDYIISIVRVTPDYNEYGHTWVIFYIDDK